MVMNTSLSGWTSSSTTSTHRTCTRAAATAVAITAPWQRHSSQKLVAQPQQQLQQQLPALSLPQQQLRLQQPLQCPRRQQQLQASQQQSRCAVVAAAGRRRRQEVGAEEDDPDLDVDDVMYAEDGDDAGDDADDADILADDDEEFEEFEEDEEADEDDYDEFEEGVGEEAAQGDEEDWSAALDEFDTAQDAEVEAAPSKEEQELAAAKAMVRYSDYFADEDGTTLTVSEVPPEEPDRPKTFDEQTVALSPADKQTLEQNMAAYTVFPVHELDLLVSSTADGRLVLSDCFCLDTVEDSFVRPTIGEHIPTEPRMYQVIPWEHTKTGDLLRHKDPEVARVKLYFLGLHSTSPHEVDMSRIYSFDVDNRYMQSHMPKVLGADSLADLFDPVMRIREDGVYIEESEEMPGSYFIAEGFAGHPEDRYNNPDKEFDIYEFVKMGMWDKPRSMEELTGLPASGAALVTAAVAAGDEEGSVLDTAAESQLEERLEELELMEELDDMPDVPAVDMM